MSGPAAHQANGQSNAAAGPSSSPVKASQPALASTQTLVNGAAPDATATGPVEPRGDGAALQQQTEEDLNQLFAARREEELARRDRSLAEFMVMLDGYKPLVRSCLSCHEDKTDSDGQIPEEVTEYYLQKAGFECSDPRLWVLSFCTGRDRHDLL